VCLKGDIMVQSVSNQVPNNLGSVNRIGSTPDGRILYQIVNGEGKIAANMSVAQKDCDTFEKSYNKMIEAAPKLQEYMEKTPPEKMQKKQKMAKWMMAGGALLGGLWPALKAKGTFKQISLTLLGCLAGFAGGMFIGAKIVTPPGAKEISEATQTISQLDIKAV
jgi:dsDNA-binding SOS-regulon protein